LQIQRLQGLFLHNIRKNQHKRRSKKSLEQSLEEFFWKSIDQIRALNVIAGNVDYIEYVSDDVLDKVIDLVCSFVE